MSSKLAIATEALTFSFGAVRAVIDLSLAVRRGEIFGLLGHNGAGKTTTIRLLNGILAPEKGGARVLGYDAASEGVQIRRLTGVLTETPSLDERLTGRDNLTIYAHLYGVPAGAVAGRVAALLARFDLAERAEEKVAHYSKGMKQRLALSRALLHQPELLFLDEPTAALDPLASRQVHELIRALSKSEGRTVVLSTHNLAEAQQLCDRVAVLHQGRLLVAGEPAGLTRQLAATRRLNLETSAQAQAQAVALLRSWPGLTAEPGESGLIQVAGIDYDAVPRLIEALVQAGIPLFRAVPQEATLADVYFALHGGSEVAP